jgi:hypothetical protein
MVHTIVYREAGPLDWEMAGNPEAGTVSTYLMDFDLSPRIGIGV